MQFAMKIENPFYQVIYPIYHALLNDWMLILPHVDKRLRKQELQKIQEIGYIICSYVGLPTGTPIIILSKEDF